MPRPSLLLAALVAASACGPAIRHDLGSVRQSAITFDDMCHLQDYFTQRVESRARPLRAINELSTETSREERDDRGVMRPVVMGEGTYVLATRTDRVRFRRLLRDEYSRLPEMHLTHAEETVLVKVTWWQAGGIRRIRPETPVEVTAGAQTFSLPPHPCIGEFLFGEPAYVMRQCFLEAQRARAAGRIPDACTLAPEAPADDAGAPPPAADAAAATTDAAVDAPAAG
jgi:hypothetical protein